MQLTIKNAVAAIEKHGALLVFPLQNRPEPRSLWSHFFPRTPMRWEWDSSGDNRVVKLWHLREELSRSGRVVYAKWFKGRATFFSKQVAAGLLERLDSGRSSSAFSLVARQILSILEDDSPQSSKILKKRVLREVGILPKEFDRAMNELWQAIRIVGYGEIDDGAFPSLAIGATSVLFEELFRPAAKRAKKTLDAFGLITDTLFEKHLQSIEANFQPKTPIKVIRFTELK